MTTIQQTVDIPADRRLRLDVALPEDSPLGPVKVELRLKSAAKSNGITHWILHPIHAYHDLQWKKTLAWIGKCQKNGPLFNGRDGVEYQREIRDEWEDRS
jgi:hypothetical protein